MDGFPMGTLLSEYWNTPCMILEAELTNWNKLECSAAIKEHMVKQLDAYHRHCNYTIQLKGADHVAFSDFALFSHMPLFKKLPAEKNMLR